MEYAYESGYTGFDSHPEIEAEREKFSEEAYEQCTTDYVEQCKDEVTNNCTREDLKQCRDEFM